MIQSNPRKVLHLGLPKALDPDSHSKALSILSHTLARPCLLLHQVNLGPVKPRSTNPLASMKSWNSLISVLAEMALPPLILRSINAIEVSGYQSREVLLNNT